jgi:protein-S-isoprenylcysteine O-methyltransferase Ste14
MMPEISAESALQPELGRRFGLDLSLRRPFIRRSQMDASLSTRPGLARTVYVRALLAIPTLWAILFIPAGTLDYWEAWVYLAILLLPMFFVFRYLLKHSPQLLERRMQMRERELAQRRIVALSFLYFAVAFTLPGFDRRWGWSDVPIWVVIVADLVVLLGYGFFVLVLRENQYASRTIQVEQSQRVISSGPYALVRHPMYLGVSLMYLASPLALGSYWALLPALLIVPILIARITHEEEVLERELAGYRDYQRATRYRLLPGVW